MFVAPAPAGDYDRAFEAEMLLCGLALAFLVGLATSWWPGLVLVGLAPVLVGDLMQTRYDLWPALLTAGTMLALLRDRHRLGWALLGTAVIAKGYAICLVPLAAFWTARRAGRAELRRAASWGAGVVAVVLVPFLAVAPHGTWESFRDQFVRPLQIESLGGSILMTAKRAQIEFTYGSHNIPGHPARLLAAGLEVVELAALLWCWWRFARGDADEDRFCRYGAAAVTAFVAFGKVLSPQYLIWLFPFVAPRPRAQGPGGGWAARRGVRDDALVDPDPVRLQRVQLGLARAEPERGADRALRRPRLARRAPRPAGQRAGSAGRLGARRGEVPASSTRTTPRLGSSVVNG